MEKRQQAALQYSDKCKSCTGNNVSVN